MLIFKYSFIINNNSIAKQMFMLVLCTDQCERSGLIGDKIESTKRCVDVSD